MNDIDRVPPHDQEVEKSTIGSMMLDAKAIDEVSTIATDKDYYFEKHGIIHKAILELHNDPEQEVDLVTVSTKLREQGQIDAVGGASYITSLVNSVPTAANARHYAKKVKDYADLRRLIKTGDKLVQMGYKKEANVTEVLDIAQEEIYKSSIQNDSQEDICDFTDSSSWVDHMDDIECRMKQGGITGLPTGFADIDSMTAGLQPGGYTIIGARPSMGKTMVAINMALNMAKEGNAGVFFSAEMRKKLVLDRFLAAESGVNSLALKKGQLSQKDWIKISDGTARLNNTPLTVIGNRINHVSDIRALTRKLKREKDIKFIMVDYLQLLQGFEDKSTKNLQVQEMSRAFKYLAAELDIHVIVLSQLSRSVEKRNNKRPQLSDLRDSGSIEQDADNIAFIYRDEYYDPMTEKKNILEFIWGKVRDGQVGTIELAYDLSIQKVFDLSRRAA
ncbi:replicative DNA helicase [Orenia marismortui]|uniref:Replicative DNA helicase n=1 Tax=Orenia marismortui TaxID=46469 RepID=A0A4R8GTX4_9FIRM|nr:replicative DNA helicase [Orenia marismortui]TDX48304.1 replicative DNA helicase [Orenia marismortui]